MADCVVVDVLKTTNNNNSDGQQSTNTNNHLLLSINVVSSETNVVNNELNNFFMFKDKVSSTRGRVHMNDEKNVIIKSTDRNNDDVSEDNLIIEQTNVVVVEDHESLCSEEENCRKKRRCADRYDSSESSDSGVAVHCADCGSSNSDITEPCSPLSTTSLDDMPPTAARRSPAPPASVVRRPPSSASPVTDQTAVQWPWTDPPSKRPKQGKITEYFRSKGGNNTKNSIIASAAANVASSLTKESSIRQSWVTSPVSKFLNSSVKSGVRLTEVGGGGCGGGGEVGGVSSSGAPSSNNSDNSCSVGGGDEVEDVDDEDEEEDDDYGVEVEEEEVAVVGRNNRRRRRRRSVKSVDSTESGGISATYSSNSNNISISKSVNSSASDCKQTSSTITSSAAVEGGKVTATATAVVTSSTSTSADCTISAENAEENSSSGASDISSLLTTSSTTSSSSSTRTAATISTAIDSSDIGIKQQIEKKDGEERTIRFPVINGWRGHYVSDVICRWTDCGAKFTTSTALLEHLQINHVNSQTLSENYVCRWSECKVYDRKSCSRTWLERHVLSHGGNKPYRCIVDGCGHRFSSQTLLQRHVNNHFTEREQKGDSKKGCETANKLIRRNGKKLRYRRQPFSARRYDYFDAGIMEGLQHNLIDVTERRTQGQFDNVPGDEVLLKSRILGRKVDENGETRVLLRWFPHNILNDEWVKLDEITRAKTVSIRRLSVQSKDNLYQYLLNTNRKRQETTEILDRRRRRKQFSSANYYYNSSSVEVSASSSSAISANSSSISAGAASVLYDAGISCNGGNVLSPSSDKSSSSSSSYSTSSSSCFSSSSTSTSTSYYNNVNNDNNNTNSDLLHQTLPFSVSLPIKTTVLTVQTT